MIASRADHDATSITQAVRGAEVTVSNLSSATLTGVNLRLRASISSRADTKSNIYERDP
jgi:hypothetical protein